MGVVLGELLRKRLHIYGITKCEVDVRAGQGHVGSILKSQGRVAARRTGEKAVEDVSQPQGAAKGLVTQELVGIVRCVMAIKNPVHLQQPRGLAEIDVGTDGIPTAPFVNDDEAESLDISEIRLVQVGID